MVLWLVNEKIEENVHDRNTDFRVRINFAPIFGLAECCLHCGPRIRFMFAENSLLGVSLPGATVSDGQSAWGDGQ